MIYTPRTMLLKFWALYAKIRLLGHKRPNVRIITKNFWVLTRCSNPISLRKKTCFGSVFMCRLRIYFHLYSLASWVELQKGASHKVGRNCRLRIILWVPCSPRSPKSLSFIFPYQLVWIFQAVRMRVPKTPKGRLRSIRRTGWSGCRRARSLQSVKL